MSAVSIKHIVFLITGTFKHPLILNNPWLHKHDPAISWSLQEIIKWSKYCQHNCLTKPANLISSTSVESPKSSLTVHIPLEYSDLPEVFSKAKVNGLPPHRPYDCTIDLLPGTTPPCNRIYPLSQTEKEAMEEYVQEALKQWCILPSTSLASTVFFFIEKKGGGLRSCTDYLELNNITVKYPYPLPLVPSALKQLRSAKIFTKLDL